MKRARLELEEVFLGNKSVTSTSACTADLFLPFFPIFQRRNATGERLTDIHCGAKIYFNNKLTHYGKSNTVGYYRGEITVYHPLCSHAQREKVGEQKEERLSDGLFGRRRRLAHRQDPRAQRAGERALVIWSVRQLGLSSETR